MLRARAGIGSAPWSRMAAWKAGSENAGPRLALASSRSRRISSCGEVGQRLAGHDHVPVDLGGEELRWHRHVRHDELDSLLPAPAEGVDAGVDHQPGGPHQRRADRTEQGAVVGVKPGFLGELLGVQAPAFREHGDAALALQGGQPGEQLEAGQLQVMPGYRLVEGHRFDVPAGAGRGPLGVEPERAGPAAV